MYKTNYSIKIQCSKESWLVPLVVLAVTLSGFNFLAVHYSECGKYGAFIEIQSVKRFRLNVK